MLLLRALFFLFLMPGTVTLFIPYLLLGSFQAPSVSWFPRTVGGLAILSGASILLWCIWQFYAEGKGTLAPVDPPKVLVVRGLYAYVRNPMYLGVLLILSGESLVFGSWEIGLEAIFFFLIVNAFIRYYEEPALRRQFGSSYEQYLKTTRRWRPRIR